MVLSAAVRRRPLDQLEAVRVEDAEQRALTRSAAKRAPVEPVPPLAGSIETGKQVGAVVARELQLDPGGVLAEADQIAVVPGAE